VASTTDTLRTTLNDTAYEALVLLTESPTPLSGRMVAALLGVAPTTATTALSKLRESGFAASSREGRADRWHLATDNPIVRAWLEERSGMSPYPTGGGGVTFERKVAVVYLGALLTGDGAPELGDGRCVVSVAFQQAPDHAVDDLVIQAARSDESDPSLVLAVSVRRSPNLVESDESTRKLIRSFVREAKDMPDDDGVDRRIALVVAGEQDHARQLATLAGLAAKQSSAKGFFDLVRTPKKFPMATVRRLRHIEALVRLALIDLGDSAPDPGEVCIRTHDLLARLVVLLPRLESPDEADWSALTNRLTPFSRGQDLLGGSQVRDRLVALASEYSPSAAVVDLKLLRRHAHPILHDWAQRGRASAEALAHLHEQAVASVRNEIASSDGARTIHLDRRDVANGLLAIAGSGAAPVVAWGEPGVGKSALVIGAVTDAALQDHDDTQVLCINLRQLPRTTIALESFLGAPFASLLAGLSAPRRFLVVDGADAIAEGMLDLFRYLVDAALQSDVTLITVTANDTRQLVRDAIAQRTGGTVEEYLVPSLSDGEVDEVVAAFPELVELANKPRSRDLLRRPVVVDLLVRGGVSGVPLSDADAMRQVWSGLVRRHGLTDRGLPDARELALLRLADLALCGGDVLGVVGTIDPAALDGLRRDGLLRISADDPFQIGPEFAHDEVRRYAVARILLAAGDPISKLIEADVPRWALGAARLACQELLAVPISPHRPLRGRFARVQHAFDELVAAGHGDRWGDVPGEALLTIGDPGPVLRDAWSDLGGSEGPGVERLSRLVDQRLRDESGFVRVAPSEPLIDALLDDEALFWSSEHLQRLVRDWLRALTIAHVPAEEPRRLRLHDRLIAACAAADHRMAEARAVAEAAHAARTPEEIEEDRKLAQRRRALSMLGGFGSPGRKRRRARAEVPRELTDESLVELLALLGPDLGDDGETILRRVAQCDPWELWPAIEELFTGTALAQYRSGFLAELTEAYYVDDEEEGLGLHEDGIRDHRARSLGVTPLAAWYRGPFIALFQSDFRNGVAVLNRMLNHAARVRVRTLAGLDHFGAAVDDTESDQYRTDLDITGSRQTYVGDGHVWSWYRGTAVGPFPCISALQALERVCDQLIEMGVPIANIVATLLDGCENLAMVGLVVSILVRHLEQADRLLDPYLAEPLVWHHEFSRMASENSGLAAPSDGLVSPDRRSWSLREAAMWLVLRADDARADELKMIGQRLVEAAQRMVAETSADAEDRGVQNYLAVVRAWASGLDRASYEARASDDGNLYIQSKPPDDVVQSMQQGNEDIQRAMEATRLFVRYYLDPKKDGAEPIKAEELVADLVASRELLENPPSLNASDPWDTPTVVSAVALEAALTEGLALPDESLHFAAEIVLRVGEGAVAQRQYEFAETYFEQGADRIAARVLPLLILPDAERIRSLLDADGGGPTRDRVLAAMSNLVQAVPNEVRVHLARGLDRVWLTPCVDAGTCHHQVALEIAIDTMRDCAMGPWDSSGYRPAKVLADPVERSLANTADGDINFPRLDAAIRALAPAAVSDSCISGTAGELLSLFLAAHRRALLACDRNMDHRGTQALMAARALLTIAQDGDGAPIYEHIEAFAAGGSLLNNFLRALSAAAEESRQRAATARRLWPGVISHVLALHHSGRPAFADRHYGDYALAALLPNATGEATYLYREVEGAPLVWWQPIEWQHAVEEWLPLARGNPTCVDQLIGFLGALELEDQARVGIPWVATLVLADPGNIANRSFLIATWLINVRDAAVDLGLILQWQQTVDALVVAGATRLAPYSE
jgi:DNA-binding transcriptional ArsR family regulator